MKLKKLFIFILFAPILVFAGDLEWSGYYEPQYMGLKIKDNVYNLMSNKLRVDLDRDLSDRVSFGANFDYITYHGKTEWNILDFLPDHITSRVPEIIRPYYKFNFGDMVQNIGPMFVARPDRIFLDNAYIRMAFKKFDLTVGKQQLSMGTGYTWNPTDLFNTKDVLDPTYEQPGHNAIRLDIPLGNRFGIVSYISPDEKWKNTAKMLKFKGKVGHFDFSVLGIQRYWSYTDYIQFETGGLYNRTLIGGDFAGELFGLGIWSEGGYNFMDHKQGFKPEEVKDHWELVFGSDYTFQSGMYIMAEYYFNSMARSNWEKYTLNNWMWMLTSEMKTISRQQVFGLIQYPFTDLITIGSYTIYSVSDQSAAFVPMVQYSLFEDVDLTIFGNIYTGAEGSAYAGNMGNGGLARLRVYF